MSSWDSSAETQGQLHERCSFSPSFRGLQVQCLSSHLGAPGLCVSTVCVCEQLGPCVRFSSKSVAVFVHLYGQAAGHLAPPEYSEAKTPRGPRSGSPAREKEHRTQGGKWERGQSVGLAGGSLFSDFLVQENCSNVYC